MTTIQTQSYVGSDGLLKLCLPVEARDRQVQVVVVVQAQEAPSAGRDSSPVVAPEHVARLAAAGIRVPDRCAWEARSVPPLPTEGKPASQTLVEDRDGFPTMDPTALERSLAADSASGRDPRKLVS